MSHYDNRANMKVLGTEDFTSNAKSWAWKWRHLIAVGVFFAAIWEMTRLQILHLPSSSLSAGGYSSSVGSMEEMSFRGPFHCDLQSLPRQVRMVRRTHENYVLLAHGFQDLVSDANWIAEGNDGWENDLTQQMEMFMKAIKTLEPSRSAFIDLGANIGSHFLQIAGKGYEAHGFEPQPQNYALVHCACAFSNFDSRVRFNHFGLGDEVTDVCMNVYSNNMGDSKITGDAPGAGCAKNGRAKIDTLDNYYDRYLRGKRIAVMKMDIQGFEIAAMKHGTHLYDSLDAPEAVFFEYEPNSLRQSGYYPPDLIRYFQERHYDIFLLPSAMSSGPTMHNGTSVPWKEEWENATGDGEGNFDVIAIKREWKRKAESAGYHFVGGTIKGL